MIRTLFATLYRSRGPRWTAAGAALFLAACGGSTTANPAVNRPPQGTIDAPPANVTIAAGGSVSFQASCTDPDGDGVTHAWSFGGGAAASTAQSPGSVTFATAGAYPVSYTCTDAKGLADPTPDTRTVTVTAPANRPPDGTIASPAASVSIAAGGSVNFQGACTDPDGDAVTHAWSFGGGAAASTVQSPGNVTFAAGGVFAVTYTCTDSHGLADPTPDTRTITVSGTTRTLNGTITFDKVPPDPSGGLDYTRTALKPVRGADVSLVDSATGATVLATAVTGSDGTYSLGWPKSATTSVKLIIFARTNSPKVFVQDNTAGKAIYALSSSTIDAASTSIVNLHATATVDAGNHYTSRSAAPFAVLDAAWQAVQAFKAVRPAVVFPDVHLNWSANNQPVGPQGGETEAQALAAGHIGTSFWSGTELYLLGQADVDTDEFDDHVIVHEWGHYFESKLGRSDSPGGAHAAGDIKDPRLAFGEGWGNALSAIIWSPATTYTDSSGAGQQLGFGFDMEDNASGDPSPGWYSEGSVQSILYDLFDSGATEGFDGVALGLGPIYDAMTGGQKTTTAMTTLFSFISVLKAANPGQAAAIDTLTRNRNVVGVNIADAYGTGETNDGGHAENLPVYRTITAGTPATVTLFAGDPNELGQNRYFRWSGTAGSHTVQIATPTADDVDLEVYQQGRLLANAITASGNESTNSFTATAGSEYIVIVIGSGTSASYTTTVTVH